MKLEEGFLSPSWEGRGMLSSWKWYELVVEEFKKKKKKKSQEEQATQWSFKSSVIFLWGSVYTSTILSTSA